MINASDLFIFPPETTLTSFKAKPQENIRKPIITIDPKFYLLKYGSLPGNLGKLTDIWENCFLFGLFSSLLLHGIAALIAFGKLRRHYWGRFFPLLIVLFGIVTPLTFGTVTSVAIAAIHVNSTLSMAPIHSLLWGLAQTVTVLFVSYSRFLFTL